VKDLQCAAQSRYIKAFPQRRITAKDHPARVPGSGESPPAAPSQAPWNWDTIPTGLDRTDQILI
jgi:hypothetical protein